MRIELPRPICALAAGRRRFPLESFGKARIICGLPSGATDLK